MNIFAPHPSPVQSAMWLDDIRKNKMILESAQMLSTAIHIISPENQYRSLYKQTHVNHPANVWIRQSRGNFVWLLHHMAAMHKQKGPTRLRPNGHKSGTLMPAFLHFAKNGSFPRKDLTSFANCAANNALGLNFKHVEDTNTAYRLYLNERWRDDVTRASNPDAPWYHMPKWDHGTRPYWANFDLAMVA